MRYLSLLCLLVAPVLAQAQEGAETLFDVVTLSAHAEREVDNDRIEAMLFAEREGTAPAALADAVNREMEWALRQLHGARQITASTPAYQTFPVYQKGLITGWRVRQTLKLDSADVTAMSELLGSLQARLGLQSVSFVLSSQRRASVEESLIAQALENFTARAQLVAKRLGRDGYRLVNLQVDTGGLPPPIPHLAMARAEMAVSAPRLEGGSSQVQVSVTGTIQLKN